MCVLRFVCEHHLANPIFAKSLSPMRDYLSLSLKFLLPGEHLNREIETGNCTKISSSLLSRPSCSDLAGTNTVIGAGACASHSM